MNPLLTAADYAALSPLLILLVSCLGLLLMESFSVTWAKKGSFPLALGALTLALAVAAAAPESTHALLTPWLRFDPMTRTFTLFFLSIGIASAFLAHAFFQRFEATRGEYYFLLLSSVFGLILIGASADFLTLFLGLETLSISLYVLCAYMKKWELSGEAALKYFLMGAVAAAFLLYGIALIYGAVGTTRFEGLLTHYQSLTASSSKALFLGGIGLVTLGLAFKAAIVPFHVWAPDAYDGAPTPVTAFMAVGTKVGAFAAFARVFLVALPHFDPLWNQGMAWLAIITMVYANVLALRQIQLRRFFAYSGISHAGFLLIPLVAETPDAFTALTFYLIVYACATLGSFAVLATLDHDSQGVLMKDLHGLFRRSPYLAALFTLCLLTLAGIPPTVGFFAKFYVFKIAFQTGYITLIIVGLLTAIISAFYYMRIVSLMLADVPEEVKAVKYSWPAAIVGIVSFAALLIFSLYPGPLLG